MVCGLLPLCASFVYVACGLMTFDDAKVLAKNMNYTYDGNAHMFEVSYDGVETNVSYSLDGENFKSREEVMTTEVGEHKVYYKLTVENYNDYVGDSLLVISGVKVIRNGASSGDYSTFESAMENAQSGRLKWVSRACRIPYRQRIMFRTHKELFSVHTTINSYYARVDITSLVANQKFNKVGNILFSSRPF